MKSYSVTIQMKPLATSSAVPSHGTIYLVGGKDFMSHGTKWNGVTIQMKPLSILNSTFTWYLIYLVRNSSFWVCGWNPTVRLLWTLFSSTFTWNHSNETLLVVWYYLFFSMSQSETRDFREFWLGNPEWESCSEKHPLPLVVFTIQSVVFPFSRESRPRNLTPVISLSILSPRDNRSFAISHQSITLSALNSKATGEGTSFSLNPGFDTPASVN